jgi:osmotically-inducible protein OsmY
VAQPVDWQITDDRIRYALEDMLQRYSGIDPQLIDVEVEKGVVKLDGYVETVRSRGRAGGLAEAMQGVRAVENMLRVRPIARSDEEIRQDVMAAIEDDPVLETKGQRITVENGEVKLTGGAGSWGERRLFAEAAGGVRGVRGVSNDLEVSQLVARGDEEVAREIQRRLRRDVWTDDTNVSVQVRRGVAKLAGGVNSAAQKRRVEEAALIRGVRNVDSSGLVVRSDPWGRGEGRHVRLAGWRDPQIAEEVKAALALDARLAASNVDVQAQDGLITLQGEVPSYFAKRGAEQGALNTVGVFEVDNRLRVRPASTLPSDEELAARVERALHRDPDVSRMNIGLDVRNGKVRLLGYAESRYERQLAEEVTSRIDGVIDLENGLLVSGGGWAADDAQLRAAVEEQLWWSPYIDERNVTVAVRHGEVTVTGHAPDSMRRELVSELGYAAGARNVINQLRVENR